jgi:hypothetical protein
MRKSRELYCGISQLESAIPSDQAEDQSIQNATMLDEMSDNRRLMIYDNE